MADVVLWSWRRKAVVAGLLLTHASACAPVPFMMSSSLAATAPRVPRHVALIPDGNGRWAVTRSLPRAAGHAAGADVAWNSARALFDRGVEVVSIFALSTENMPPAREASEVSSILRLTTQLLRSHRDMLADSDIAVQVVHAAGCEAHVPEELRTAVHAISMRAASRQPAPRRAPRVLNLAVAYGGRADIADAARALARKAVAGTLAGGIEAIDEHALAAHLSTGIDAPCRISSLPGPSALPDVDLVIRCAPRRERRTAPSCPRAAACGSAEPARADACRGRTHRTSGERRLSNFLLWQCAYAELHFSQALWPDFGPAELDAALEQFRSADRRFGRARAELQA
jgi:undecaprenyl diphosphate synthase